MKRVSTQPLAVSRVAFEKWLASNPRDGDRPFGAFGVRYQVGRYCDYLNANPCQSGDPLRDARARDEAVSAYRHYLETFSPASAVAGVLDNLDHFYLFLGLGPVARRPGELNERESSNVDPNLVDVRPHVLGLHLGDAHG